MKAPSHFPGVIKTCKVDEWRYFTLLVLWLELVPRRQDGKPQHLEREQKQ
jgi:hypothetical protein